jgi:hypothetical protein
VLGRREDELKLVQEKYGEIEVGPTMTWVLVKRFPLPPGWSKREAQILVLLPPGYPTTPPDNFFADNDLRLADGRLPTNASSDQRQVGRTWLQFSHHVEANEWRPSVELLRGHNLLTFLLAVELRLAEVN